MGQTRVAYPMPRTEIEYLENQVAKQRDELNHTQYRLRSSGEPYLDFLIPSV
jgi:hypothetical protein